MYESTHSHAIAFIVSDVRYARPYYNQPAKSLSLSLSVCAIMVLWKSFNDFQWTVNTYIDHDSNTDFLRRYVDCIHVSYKSLINRILIYTSSMARPPMHKQKLLFIYY